jgi:hypothetical protein
MRIDQDGCDPAASQHRGRGGARDTPADDGNLSIFHAQQGPNGPIIAPGMTKNALAAFFTIFSADIIVPSHGLMVNMT